MSETHCTGCHEALDASGVTDEIAYDSDGDVWHKVCLDDFKAGE